MMADSEAAFQRTHPATVVVRSVKALWQTLIALVAIAVFGGLGDAGLPALAVGSLIFLVVAAGVGGSWLSWWRFQYAIVGSDLVVVEGLLVRKRRTIPIARVHGVNVTADLFMRLLGLVEIVVQTAGGGANEPEAKIGAIPLDRAEELRNLLLYDSSATMPATAATPDDLIGADPVGRISDFRGAFGGAEKRGREMRFEHKVPPGRLIVGEITSNRVPIVLLVFFGLGAQVIEVVGTQLLAETASRATQIAVPVLALLVFLGGLFAVVVATFAAVARDFGFTARRFETRIETEAGLFERRQISMPVTRIQAVRIEESWLRRMLGLATIHVDTAGLERGGQQGQPAAGSKAMVPVARRADLPMLMHELLPEAEFFPGARDLPRRALRFYLLVPTVFSAILAFLMVVPASCLIYRPALPFAIGFVAIVAGVIAVVRALQWRRAGVGTNETAVTLRSGVLGRKRVRLTRSRIQSLTVQQNPFQRRAKLATLRTVSVTGSARAAYGVSHLDEAEAMRILEWYQAGLPRPQTA